jgi:MoaA/NifB/PqqE/SkfB family radical SAM enzyme
LIGNKFGGHSNWPRGLMSADLLAKILDKARRECEVGWVSLFNWTEPLLHPEIVQLVRLVKARGIPISLSSDLNVLRDADDLLASAPDFLRVSLSGFTQPIYNRGHRGGNIEIVKKNMLELAAAKARTSSTTHIDVFYHRYAYNLHEAEPMRQFAEKLGFNFIAFGADFSGGKDYRHRGRQRFRRGSRRRRRIRLFAGGCPERTFNDRQMRIA